MTKFLEKSVKIAGSRFYGQDVGLRMRENNYVRYRDDTQIQFLYVQVDDGGVRSLAVERRTAERAAGVRFPTCVPLARIQNRYGIPTGQFGSCPISIWRPGVLGLSSPGT